jgi:hypothetical protein
MDKWPDPESLESTIHKAGFWKANIALIQRDVYCHAAEFDNNASMLWSFIGVTTAVGWLESDEEDWQQAIHIAKEHLLQTDCFQLLGNGRVRLDSIANIAVAIE